MNRIAERHLQMQEQVTDMMQQLTVLQYETDQARARNDLAEGDLADIGYLEREMERLLDHHRKESKSRQLSIGSGLCEVIMHRFGEGDGELKARGSIANASPDVKQEPIIPKKGDPEYSQLMRSLGIPDSLASEGAISIHFKRMGDYLTRLSREGKNPPGRLLKRAVLQVVYRSNTRKKKD